MPHDTAMATVRQLMATFAELTGLSPVGQVPRRYLWTDAFAVCNFLELYRQTGDEAYMQLARRLVEQVHDTLGHHRHDDPRRGWISGLDEQEGRQHPTRGGLRIGKSMPERGPAEPFDERTEWDRDGQYYHYLTKWMQALNRVSRVTGDATYQTWALELAKTAHARFTYVPSSGGQKRMYWKMSIDLSYPLVSSMGQHDPLDGLITYRQLQATATTAGPDLTAEIADMTEMCRGRSWATDDPLGLGGLLSDAYRVAQLMRDGYWTHGDVLETLLDAALLGLATYARQHPLQHPAAYRLAFRELGLAIGLRAVPKVQRILAKHPNSFEKLPALQARIETLMRYSPVHEIIETFWLEPANREASTWTAHGEINMVMLATSLAPEGYLTL
jgi:hypothetical protein